MRALVDFHHSDLLESLHRLLEDRLDYEVHVPHGMEWFTEGIWRQGHAHFGDAIARQFLLAPEVDDLQPNRRQRRTTLAEARELDFDLVVASVPDNYAGYARFAAEKGARFAIEVGNVNQYVDTSLDPLILDSTGKYPSGVPFTPEFDTEAFRYDGLEGVFFNRLVASFVNLFPGLPCYPLMEATQAELPEWEFNVFGHNGPQGFQKPTARIGDLMRSHDFIWHDKITGDGFGYVIHYAAAVGRPLIGHASHYRGQVAEDLWEDGVTCIDLDKHSPAEAAQLMEEIVVDPARHTAMCEAIHERFLARVDFEADAKRVMDALSLVAA